MNSKLAVSLLPDGSLCLDITHTPQQLRLAAQSMQAIDSAEDEVVPFMEHVVVEPPGPPHDQQAAQVSSRHASNEVTTMQKMPSVLSPCCTCDKNNPPHHGAVTLVMACEHGGCSHPGLLYPCLPGNLLLWICFIWARATLCWSLPTSNCNYIVHTTAAPCLPRIVLSPA